MHFAKFFYKIIGKKNTKFREDAHNETIYEIKKKQF